MRRVKKSLKGMNDKEELREELLLCMADWIDANAGDGPLSKRFRKVYSKYKRSL